MTAPHSLTHETISRWSHFWFFILTGCLVALMGRLIYIQNVMSDSLLTYRDSQQTRSITTPAHRGMIMDTQGRILAGSKTLPSVYADPQLIIDVDMTSDKLATIVGVPKAALQNKILQRNHKRFVWIARKISDSEAEAIRLLKLPGVVITNEPHRYYPNGNLSAHILGFVNSESQGLEGLELQFNDTLTGTPGKLVASCDARRRPLWSRPDKYIPPVHGQHLVLTIDAIIQGYAEAALEAAVKKFQAESGVSIVMSPKNGDILAMCCYPSYNPNYHREYTNDAKRNRCLTDPVEPGSIFKPFVMSAALAEGVATVGEKIDCGPGVWYFGGRRLRDTHANGVLSLEEVLVKSSNIGMGKLGTRLGNERLHHYVCNFGYGQVTGIELPGENKGIVLSSGKWTSYSKTSVPMGQELAVTPIQLITAFAALTNHGSLVKPRLVRTVLDPGGEVIQVTHDPENVRQAVPEMVADIVSRQFMVRMVQDTHHDVKLAHYQMLGKTGTAQVPYRHRRGYEPDAYLGSFLGAAPSQDPQITALIMIRKPNKSLGYYGGKVAGPAVREIIERTLAYWNIPHDPETGNSIAMN